MFDLESLFPLIGLGWLLMVGVFVWGVIDRSHLLGYAGEIKRGIKIRSEPLPPAKRVFLESLTRDIVEERLLLEREVILGFIDEQMTVHNLGYEIPVDMVW